MTTSTAATNRLDSVLRQLPERAVELAYHAALPVAVDAELLHLLRMNFLDDLPWSLEARLLLSPLFRDLGEGLYEIEPDLRTILLVGLNSRFGPDRLHRVALLLEQYCEQTLAWEDRPELDYAQRLTALHVIDPGAAETWLASNATGTEAALGSSWHVAMRGHLATNPSPEATLDEELDAAITRLAAARPGSRTAAVRAVGVLGALPGTDPAPAVRALHSVAATGSPTERNQAANALARLGTDIRTGSLSSAPPGSPAQTAYLEQVRRIAPPALLDREAELADLATFCSAPDPAPSYAVWEGGPWSGKSALMASFVLHPPPGVRIVSFFVTARFAGQDDRDAFVDVVVEQLRDVLYEPVPSRSGEAVRSSFDVLLARAADACRHRGERLVLVVDGLDEDRGVSSEIDATSIAALLPAAPREGLRVIATRRESPPLSIDVPAHHPLRDSEAVRQLPATRHAGQLDRVAGAEVRRLVRGTTVEVDIAGLLTASRLGLTRDDLVELTGHAPWSIDEHLATPSARSYAMRGWLPGRPIYMFASRHLLEAAGSALGSVRVDDYRARLRDWAERYQSLGWPAGTPEFLTGPGYWALLSKGGLLELGSGSAYLARVRDRHGGDDQLLTAVRSALGATPVMSRKYFAFLTEVERNAGSMSALLPMMWAEAGEHNRAESLIRLISDPGARSAAWRKLIELAAKVGDLARLDRLTRLHPDAGGLAWAQLETVRAIAESGELEAATAMARIIEDPDVRQEAGAALLAAGAQLRDENYGLPDHLEYADLPRPDKGTLYRVPVGISAYLRDPVFLNFAADPHCIVAGEPGCGKTSLLRVIGQAVIGRHTPAQARIFLVDYRRTLLGAVPPEYLLAYGTSTQATAGIVKDVVTALTQRLPGPDVTAEQRADRSWWKGPELFVLIDDYELVAGANNPLLPLLDLSVHSLDIGLHLVIAHRPGLPLSDPVVSRLRADGSATAEMADVLESRFAGRVALPPGRGFMVRRHKAAQLVQFAWTPDWSSPPPPVADVGNPWPMPAAAETPRPARIALLSDEVGDLRTWLSDEPELRGGLRYVQEGPDESMAFVEITQPSLGVGKLPVLARALSAWLLRNKRSRVVVRNEFGARIEIEGSDRVAIEAVLRRLTASNAADSES